MYTFVLTKSTLSRYETGTLPPLDYAQHLDQLYDADGWIDMGLRTLWRPQWKPWEMPDAWPQRMHFMSWPADFSGLVWIKLIPAATTLPDTAHTVMLDWGPWARSVRAELPEHGVVLATGKAADPDGISRTLNLTSDLPIHILFGAGQVLEGESVIDIREGWSLAHPERAGPPPL